MDAGAPEAPPIRCAPFHEAEAADPVGSAGHYDAFLVVEVPLPWARDISMCEPFATLAGGEVLAAVVAADGRRWRPMGVVPAPGSDRRRVTAYDRSVRGGGGPYRRREWTVPPSELVGLCRAVLDGTAPPASARPEEVAAEVVDLLVCTHGRRDVCCGGAGSLLYAEVEQLCAGRPDVRVRRCSHTGGHRFAPTALTFPDGFAWAHLDPATAAAVARRGPDDAVPAGSCRGASSVPAGAWQAVDREGLVRWGWRWASAERELAPLPEPADAGDAIGIEVRAQLPGEGPVVLRAVADVGRLVPTPACGAHEGDEVPTEPEWRVRDVATDVPAQ
ncbi:MAG: sucrase ferredoxin [Microthrixaceae bacterium]